MFHKTGDGLRNRTVIIVVATIALILGLSPAAYAADHSMVTNDRLTPAEDPIGSMWFNERGDVVTLCDSDADGMKPTLHVALYDPYDPVEYTLTVGGEGNCITRKASSGRTFDLPETPTSVFSSASTRTATATTQPGTTITDRGLRRVGGQVRLPGVDVVKS